MVKRKEEKKYQKWNVERELQNESSKQVYRVRIDHRGQ